MKQAVYCTFEIETGEGEIHCTDTLVIHIETRLKGICKKDSIEIYVIKRKRLALILYQMLYKMIVKMIVR